jgi:Icc-related predicted phosphoesterase
MDAPPENTGDRRVRIAAAGDMHCRARDSDEVVRTFAALRGAVDLVLLAGDLTNLGRPEQAAVLAGEPEGIWAFLGSDRLAAPIAEHEPDLVLHGHAHAGTFEGAIGEVPVYNVSVPVMARDFWLFELEARSAGRTSIH